MKLTGAEIVAEVLLEHDVDTVFGYPGGAALFIYDALYKYSDKIRHVLTAHEQGASHAADGYARATGKTGVVIATSGPGATNLVTGIATANMDSIPMVAITANVANSSIGKDAFQEVCITGVTLPITKHNYFVNNINDLEGVMRNAFRIANEGRKGPVLVDITKDVTAALMDFERKPPIKLAEKLAADEDDVKKIAEALNHAERPILYVGGGITASGAENQVRDLMEMTDAPAVYTMMAAGSLVYEDDKNLGMVGMHGSVAANLAIDGADVVVALGTRFSDRVALNCKKFARKATIVQIDIDRSEINKNVKVDISAVGDCKKTLDALLPLVDKRNHTAWIEKTTAWKKKYSIEMEPDHSRLRPQQVIGSICDMTDRDTIYVTDVGQHQMWAAQYLKHRHTRRFISSGGLGTMGFGYGAAIGAKIGCMEERVIHITGDASFHMNLNEAATAVCEGLPIITIILNNSVLGMVYQWQNTFYEGRHAATAPVRKTDFVKVIEGFGGKGYKATNQDEFEQAFKEALKADGPVWIECMIDSEEKVLPMIPNGGTVNEMIIE